MSRVAEIVSAIGQLSPEERREVLAALEEMLRQPSAETEEFWHKLEDLEQGR